MLFRVLWLIDTQRRIRSHTLVTECCQSECGLRLFLVTWGATAQWAVTMNYYLKFLFVAFMAVELFVYSVIWCDLSKLNLGCPVEMYRNQPKITEHVNSTSTTASTTIDQLCLPLVRKICRKPRAGPNLHHSNKAIRFTLYCIKHIQQFKAHANPSNPVQIQSK